MESKQKQESFDDTRITVFLLDDNETDIRIARRAFEKSKFKTNLICVKSGMELMEYVFEKNAKIGLSCQKPDIILLDIKMPKMNGFEVLKNLKNNLITKVIPVVILSSSSNESDINQSYSLGAASYLQKPINFNEFQQMIDLFNQYWHQVNRFVKRIGDAT